MYFFLLEHCNNIIKMIIDLILYKFHLTIYLEKDVKYFAFILSDIMESLLQFLQITKKNI